MKRLNKSRAATLVLTSIMGFAAVAYSQTGEKALEKKHAGPQKVDESTTADAVRSARFKIPAGFEVRSFGKGATTPTTTTFDATLLLGNGPKSDVANRAQTQASAEDAQALAKKLANPIASLISVPFQNNFDFGMGPNKDGFRYTMNFQPVIPFALTKDLNVISRTILPVIAQHNVVGTSTQFGLGDIVQSIFFSPNKSEPLIWGVGPVMLIPTGTDKYLGTQKFGIGPTAVVLKQQKKWTVGMLFNHIWSVAGKDSRPDVSSTFLQPFLSYTSRTAWTFTLNTESTYDWTAKSWGVPIHLQAAKLIKIGKQPISVGGGLRCWATSAPGGPKWCGFRIIFTPLFPKS